MFQPAYVSLPEMNDIYQKPAINVLNLYFPLEKRKGMKKNETVYWGLVENSFFGLLQPPPSKAWSLYFTIRNPALKTVGWTCWTEFSQRSRWRSPTHLTDSGSLTRPFESKKSWGVGGWGTVDGHGKQKLYILCIYIYMWRPWGGRLACMYIFMYLCIYIYMYEYLFREGGWDKWSCFCLLLLLFCFFVFSGEILISQYQRSFKRNSWHFPSSSFFLKEPSEDLTTNLFW